MCCPHGEDTRGTGALCHMNVQKRFEKFRDEEHTVADVTPSAANGTRQSGPP